MKRLPGSFSASLLITLFVCSALVWAQSDRASIVGRVTDATGALVSGATVKVTNEATGIGFETTTDDGGRYVTPNILKPGTYKVEISRDGFKTKVTSGVLLQIGDVKEVNVSLEVGAAGETITVTSEAPQLETETSSRGDVITGRQVTELPLRDRNFTNLALLTPGVSRALIGNLTDAQYFNQGDANAGNVPGGSNERGSTESARFSRSGGASISANGLRPTNNNFSLDGVDNNEPQFGTIGVFPNPDAIAEFKVETSAGKAEVGRGGANINSTFLSGTNKFHGSVYYYGQNDALNATHPQLKRDRSDLVAGGLTPEQAEAARPKSTIHVNEFGFTFGGPIIKDRTFFFGDYLGQRNSIPNAFRTVVPTAGSRMGDFTGFGTVFDPQTCNTPGVADSGGCTAFTGNNVANDYGSLQNHPNFSAPGFALLNAYPLPTIDVVNPGQGNENFFGTRANTETINSYDVKIDHRISDKNNLWGRYSRSNQSRFRANFFPVVPTAGFGAGDEVGNTRQVSISDAHAFRPTILNEAKFGWTQIEIGIFNCGVGGACGVSATFCDDIGIPNCNTGTLPTSGGILTGGFGNGFFEFTGDGGLFLVKSNNFFVADSLTIISGKHTWKAGFELRPRRLDTIDGGRSGGLKGNLPYGDNGTGNAQANILLGQPSVQAFRGTVALDANGEVSPFRLRASEWSFYVQDDWKVASNLTLNLGVRYDIYPGFSERDGRLANFDLAISDIIKASGSGDSLIDTDHSNFGPRVGFAYSFGDERQFVLRGGYGLFYSQDGVDYPPLVRNPPVTGSIAFNAFGGTPNTMFSLTTGPPVVTIVDPPVLAANTPLFTLQPEQKTATIHEWNVTLQWQFARDWLFDLGYVGTRSRNLLSTRQLGTTGSGLGLATTSGGVFIDSVTAYENRTGGNYDALQAKLEKRFSKGVLALVSYTWGHGIDDSSGVYTAPGDQRGGNFGPINPFDHNRDRGNSSLDHRHQFVTNAIWDLPIGRGKAMGGDVSSGWDKVIGGWQANVILSGQTGQHFSVGANGPSGDTVSVLIGDPFSSVPTGRYLNPAAFASPTTNPLDPGFAGTTCVARPAGFAPGQICFGNSGRNQFTGPGFFRTDFSLFKNTKITERVNTQFGVEFFNLFNHDNRVIPQNFSNNGDFGLFRNSLTPRTVQYRFKIIF
ncbi:MAG: carboxypeptidase regulatory-like domain-containing protein [Terriglobales bacterium]